MDLLVLLNIIWGQCFNVCTISCLQITNTTKSFEQCMYNFLFANTVELRFTDAHLIQTPHCYRQFSLSLVLTASQKFNPLNMDSLDGPLSLRVNGVSL